MSKLGRYSADRKKVESVTASKSVAVADCGTVFTVVGDAAVTLTLPAISDAGNGWWCKVIKTGLHNGGQDVTISAADADGDTPMMGVDVSGTEAALIGDDLVIDDTATKGTQVEILCDGSNWQVLSFSTGSGNITIG